MTSAATRPFLDKREWSVVRDLPAEFAPYEAEDLIQMSAAASGKTAFLQLHFELRDGKTRLIRNFSGGHQIVRQVHYMDAALDDMAVVFIQAVSAGVLQGDRVRIEIDVGPGARVLVTTQSSTKVFQMAANYASQRIDVKVGPDAYAEVLMDPLIACTGARLYNEVNLEVDPTGTLVYDEHLTPGRVAHGESWQFDHLYSRMRCSRPNGELIAADTNVLTPKKNPVTTPGLFGEHSDMGVMYVIAEHHPGCASLADAMHDSLQDLDDVIGSASVLPSGVGAHARALGMSTSRTERAMHACWQAVRMDVLGVDVTPIYRIKHGFEPSIVRRTTPET